MPAILKTVGPRNRRGISWTARNSHFPRSLLDWNRNSGSRGVGLQVWNDPTR